MIGRRGQRANAHAAALSFASLLVAAVLLVPAARAADANSARPGDPSSRTVRRKSIGTIEERRVKQNGDDGYGWLRTLGALGLVVAMIFLARYVLRRFSATGKATGRAEAIEVVARATLGARQQLSLVRLGKKLVLVGSGPSGMSPLAEVTEPEEVTELLAEARAADRGTFARLFRRYVQSDEEKQQPAASEREPTGKPRSGSRQGSEKT